MTGLGKNAWRLWELGWWRGVVEQKGVKRQTLAGSRVHSGAGAAGGQPSGQAELDTEGPGGEREHSM